MFYAYKRINGNIQVKKFKRIEQIQKTFKEDDIYKIILPYKAKNLLDAAIKAGRKFEGSQGFLIMEKQENGTELPKFYR
jgi:hypothetical protein